MPNDNGTDHVLFVCTGNTCRSPMAAALWRQMGGSADSAGLYAKYGSPAAVNAVNVMRIRGLDLSDHQSKPVTPELMRQADIVVAMTEDLALNLGMQYPEEKEKIIVMPGGIPDPFGGDEDDYERCANAILAALWQLKS